MAFSTLNNAQTTWYMANRRSDAPPTATPGTCLVSDLAVNDYLVGSRLTVTATGSTVSGVRTLTVKRAEGPTFTVAWVAASSVIVIRP